MRPRVYISGALTDGGSFTDEETRRHIAAAAYVYRQLVDLSFAPHLPHLTMYLPWHYGVNITYETWLEIDKSLIEGFDALYRIGSSKGADAERDHAERMGVPVFTDMIAMHGHFKARNMIA